MSGRASRWAPAALWLALPFTGGSALGQALQRHSTAVRATGSVELWAAWVVVLVATLVPHPLGLTALRCAAPGVVAAAVAAVATGHPGPAASIAGIAGAVAVAVVTFLPSTGIVFVNGPAYPNERRFPLAIPGPLLLGPLEVAWAAVVGLPVVASVLLASRRWGSGGIAAVLAAGAVWALGRALHGLSRRWVVFVPAGLVLHDPMSLADPVLFPHQVIDGLGPAPAGSDSLDLTQRAPGLALELRLTEKVPMVRITGGRRRGEQGSSARLLFTPTRPGAVLAEAAGRRIRVGTELAS